MQTTMNPIDEGDSDDSTGLEGERLMDEGFEHATLEIELKTPFLALLELEAAEQDKSVEELAKSWLWVTWTQQYKRRYDDFKCDVDIGVPRGAYRRAELFAAATSGDVDVDDVLINHVLDFEPHWVVDGEVVNESGTRPMTTSHVRSGLELTDVEQAVIDALEATDEALGWNDLQRAVGDDVADGALEDALDALFDKEVVLYNGRRGGYALVEE